MGEIVFDDRDELDWLEGVIHPRVGAHVLEWRQGLGPDVEVAVVEVPLLFEAAMEDAFDATVAVVADDEIRERACASAARRASRAERAASSTRRRRSRRADHVIRNDGSLEELEAEVRTLIERLEGEARGDARRLGALGAHALAEQREPRPASGGSRGGARSRRRRTGAGRRIIVIGGTILVAAAGVFLIVNSDRVQRTLEEVTLPLRHEDIIRQQAAGEGRARRSDRGGDLRRVALPRPDLARRRARADADHPEHREADREAQRRPDLQVRATSSDPDINIRYGTFYLRYLLDKFDGNEVAALAAYNAGETNVAAWGGSSLQLEDIPFPETRGYVENVLEKRDEYAQHYRHELGLD